MNIFKFLEIKADNFLNVEDMYTEEKSQHLQPFLSASTHQTPNSKSFRSMTTYFIYGMNMV